MDYITEVNSLDREFPFAIYNGVGFSHQDEKEGKIYMHNHHCLEINFCLSGDGQYTITDTVYPIQKDDIFIINNLEYHMARNLSGNMHLMVIVFDPEWIMNQSGDYQYIRSFYEWKEGFKHRLPGNSFVTEEIKTVLYSIQKEWDSKEVGWTLMVKSLLLMLLSLLYRQFESTTGFAEKVKSFQTDYLKLSPAIQYMEEHFRENISLSMIAAQVHMSAAYFSSLFSQTLNYTVSDYLIRIRLKNACMLLTTTKDPILSIALESGFDNISYFNRVFKNYFGVTPGQYRKHIDSTTNP